MRIALLGCNSLLAGYLIERLLMASKVRLTLLGRRLPNDLPSDAAGRIEFKLFDFPNAPPNILELLEHDALIYCAAAGVQARQQSTEAAILAVNYEVPTDIIAALCQQQYRGKWLSFGSYFELGHWHGGAATETDILAALGPVTDTYCASKRQLTAFIANQIVPFTTWHLILPTIYGARENSDRLIPYLVRNLREGVHPQLSAGNQVRQYIHGRDIADLAAQLIMNESVPSGIYNMSGPNILAIKDLIEQVFEKFGQSASGVLGTVHTRDENMPSLYLDDSKLKAALPEWQPQYPLDKGLVEYLQ